MIVSEFLTTSYGEPSTFV